MFLADCYEVGAFGIEYPQHYENPKIFKKRQDLKREKMLKDLEKAEKLKVRTITILSYKFEIYPTCVA